MGKILLDGELTKETVTIVCQHQGSTREQMTAFSLTMKTTVLEIISQQEKLLRGFKMCLLNH